MFNSRKCLPTLSQLLRPYYVVVHKSNYFPNMILKEYNNVSEFLVKLAHRLGRMKKGGIPDTIMAARSLINDWITGKITYYTEPPCIADGEGEGEFDLSLKDHAMDTSAISTE
ncbi:Guanine nucleotide-binding protein-like 3 [Schistosoma japonicum]|uniref:Guanine nucleotide-binding protein-like 3 n=1 Tax=Schistosoma japonicum TaxID=6182 RepID=A0A4Z2DBZ8_SCHJA|nr:Guanine nucleotide-binding protein-like 3 [Schistosoma japonicum]